MSVLVLPRGAVYHAEPVPGRCSQVRGCWDELVSMEDPPAGLRPCLKCFPDTPGSVVYYGAVGDDLIKIGYSGNLAARAKAIPKCCLYHKPFTLMATEPGGRPEELARHRQFAEERVNFRQELFRPSPRLLFHITGLQLQAMYDAEAAA